MDSGAWLLFLLSASTIGHLRSEPMLRLPSEKEIPSDYCDSWRLAVETNNAGAWERVPPSCVGFVAEYMSGKRYRRDCDVVGKLSSAFARSVELVGDGRDAWVFDIDETLLSNLPYYQEIGFGFELFNETSFDNWVKLAAAPALPSSFSLYNELQELGFTVFLLTGRSEYQRNATETNLLLSGYKNWERLFLRGSSDQGKPASTYKSEKRAELESEGYRIHGNSGDQWSDLGGYAVAARSFKIPNPMYYIP
ncbi:acid phosphatase 1 [Cajanus cajan]|uniref:Acid phosphatase 1 n=1 Tax=Cajanus cajan TaxID=3821 RepID=A0A151T2U1_CAJCA|nr:acid phosphatase 1 [Cajanus cajan]KYP61392.1 Acid phosphatase 1 [Cajanus cajan]